MRELLSDKLADRVGGIRAAFRSEEKASALKKATDGIEKVQISTEIDAFKPDTLASVFDGADVAVIVTPLDHSRGFADDSKLTINMIDAAYRAGCKHVVYVGSWTVHFQEEGGVPLLAARFAPAEARLAELAEGEGAAAPMGHTILRSGYFMQNFLAAFGSLKEGSGEELRFIKASFPPVDVRDVGRLAAHAAVDPGAGREARVVHEVSGPEMLSTGEIAGVFAKGLGREVRHVKVEAGAMAGVLPPALGELMAHMEGKGKEAIPCSDVVQKVTGSATSLEEWVRENKGAFEVVERKKEGEEEGE